jgi:tetratricopeptide (TPR) repeat protein
MECLSEDAAVALAKGGLDTLQRAPALEHLDACPDCRALVAALARRGSESPPDIGEATTLYNIRSETTPELLQAGALLGRYVVEGCLGSGGMGVVYAAKDPELQRTVAIKLLRGHPRKEQDPTASQGRILREAQALARLAHPHVVSIFDVGTAFGQVFLAMEWVDGSTLKEWCAACPRSTEEVLEVFAGAGRGLAAAHAAGLIHRDFKPTNVLIDRRGRARVTDFGLARMLDDGTPAGEENPSPQLSSPPPLPGTALASPLTTTGLVLGTPAYMAPEQIQGWRCDGRADQYSFCVALCEALFRTRPAPDAAPTGSGVPGWLCKVIARGIRANPDERYPSMEALLDALGKDPRARWRRRGSAAGAMALGVAVLAGGYAWEHQRQQVCKGAERKLAGVWDEGVAAAGEKAFQATGSPFAAAAWRGVKSGFDSYARGWVRMHEEACEATRLHQEQSAEMLDLRMACLSERLQSLKASAQVLSHADAQVVLQASPLPSGLPPLSECADARALRAPVRAHLDAAAQARVEEARGDLATAYALEEVGKVPEGLKVAQGALARARTAGDDPLLADALLRVGHLQMQGREDAASEKTLDEAFYLAVGCRYDEAAAQASAWLVRVLGLQLVHREEAHRWAKTAAAVVRRGLTDPLTEGELDRNLGNLDESEDNHDEALPLLQRAREIFEKAEGPDSAMAAGLHEDMGYVFDDESRFDDALKEFRTALAIDEKTLPPGHPELGTKHVGIAKVLTQEGKLDEALVEYRVALDIITRALSGENPDVAAIRHGIGEVFFNQGKYDEALVEYRAAAALQEKVLGPDTIDIADTGLGIGNVLVAQGKYDEALASYRKALQIGEKTFGNEHPFCAEAHENIAAALEGQGHDTEALEENRRALAILMKVAPESEDSAAAHNAIGHILNHMGRPAEAVPELQSALALRQKVDGPEHPATGWNLGTLGEVYLAMRDFPKAVDYLSRGQSILEAKAPKPEVLGELRFALARALWSSGQTKRAGEMARKAERDFGGLPARKADAREVAVWLQAHAG